MASDRAFYYRANRAVAATWCRVDWDDVAAVRWPGGSVQVVTLAAGRGASWVRVARDLAIGSQQRDFARERPVGRRRERHGRRTFAPDITVVARRIAGRADIAWATRLDERCDPAHPAIDEAVDMALAALRADLGCREAL